MNKFDAKVDHILQEFVGGLIKGAAQGINAFNQTLTTPSALSQYWTDTPKSSKDLKGKDNPYAYSAKNPPNVGDIVVWSVNPQYRAKVVQKMDSSGNYGIVPSGPNNIPANYIFVKTADSKGAWVIAKSTDVNLNNMTHRGFAILQEKNVVQICPKQRINNKVIGVDYIMIGNTKTPIDNWISEKGYQASQNQSTPSTTPTPANSSNPSSPASPSSPSSPQRTPRSPRRNNQQSNP
jgi:hypothetical protein